MIDGPHLRGLPGADPASGVVDEVPPLLDQRLVTCPQCGGLSALHVDQQAWRVVRFVCPTSCVLDPAIIEGLIAPDAAALTA
jgi:hypothetical protein